MADYLSITYSLNRAPKSTYPKELIQYLCARFNLSPGNKLLEIGCGRGDFLTSFQEAGLECYGVDREPSSKSASPHLKIEVADLETANLPFPDSTFDVIYHKSVIEHFWSPKKLMDETYRVLKPDGKCIIMTPDWVSCMEVFYEDITHCRPYDLNAVRDTLTFWDFREIQVEKIFQLPVIWRFPIVAFASRFVGLFIGTRMGRWLTHKTGIKFFRWSVERMILGFGKKPK